jgi:hypothetical protein
VKEKPENCPSFIHLYDATTQGEVESAGLADFLETAAPAAGVDVRGDFLCYWLSLGGRHLPGDRTLARRLAGARMRQLDWRETGDDALPGEIDFELRFLRAGAQKPSGIMYDGHQLGAIYAGLLAPEEATPEHCHISLTPQLLGTWNEQQARYHARVSVYGFPSLISTTGLVEGPAKPRGFYLGRRLGLGRTRMKATYEGRCLLYGDPRMQRIVQGYLLQALFYHITGNPFCEIPDCRLFDAHWQEELIRAQARPGAGLCDRHRRIQEAWA